MCTRVEYLLEVKYWVYHTFAVTYLPIYLQVHSIYSQLGDCRAEAST